MKKEIHDIIDQNLPAMAAKQMREFIVQAEEVRENLNKSEAEVERQAGVILEYIKLEEKYTNLDKWEQQLAEKNEALLDREKGIQTREDRIDIKIAELRLECVNLNMENMIVLVGKVFGHPRVQVDTTRQIPVVDQYGVNSTQYGGDNETRTESKV